MAPKASELTVNKVLAGAGAAATTAVLGSFFGAAGTVAGAALGSVASTVAATLYQRSLDRTRETIVARIRVPRGRGVGVADGSTPGPLSPDATMPMPRLPAGGETVRLRVQPAVASTATGRRWAMWVGATVLVFVVGLLVVTGLEAAKGSALTSDRSGTSVGRVLDAGSAEVEPASERESVTEAEPSSTPEPTTSTEPEPTESPDPSAPDEPGSEDADNDPADPGSETATDPEPAQRTPVARVAPNE